MRPARGRPIVDDMARVLRTALDDGFFHVTARGVNKSDIYLDVEDRRTFLALFVGAVRRYGWETHTLCLMTNHFHLVLETTVEAMSRGMQWLNGAYGRIFNDRWERSGHVFGERFYSKSITDDEQLLETCRYVIWNPVRAGLCEHPSQWPWSASRYGLSGH
jgi:REP element-mobilizing transposase RayT